MNVLIPSVGYHKATDQVLSHFCRSNNDEPMFEVKRKDGHEGERAVGCHVGLFFGLTC